MNYTAPKLFYYLKSVGKNENIYNVSSDTN